MVNYAYFTPEEYLDIERLSPIKHEYVQGQMYAMTGASKAHVLIIDNVLALIKPHLRGSGCLSYSAAMKVRIEACNLFYYPDVVVTCDERDRASREDFIRYPKLIIEVLSAKTEAFDRGDKFADYKTLDSLEEYVLISPDNPSIECFRRSPSGWQVEVYRGEETVRLSSIDWQGAIASLYENVDVLQ